MKKFLILIIFTLSTFASEVATKDDIKLMEELENIDFKDSL